MRSPNSPSRRQFVQQVGLVAGAALASAPTAVEAAQPARDPDAVLALLREGNKRFTSGQTSLLSRRRPSDFAGLAEGQAPIVAIIGCADSRVAPELIFDQGAGDLFVVRVAGNVVDGAGAVVKGSIEFAVAELGVQLIMVLGHSKCGAVKAAIQHVDAHDSLPGSIDGLVEMIKPAVADASGKPGDKLEAVTKANVARSVAKLKTSGPIIPELVKAGKVKIVGAVYELSTGAVEVFS
ncbi:MAG: carbonic anhydrase [Paludisphaera borealis]|uniref:carbonic anhydrase n=1 Tax=Paludisphaera borealis TaxID=1387353 RepID=UPI00283DC2E5|nr:carbonic anhydrase [Paludisphaera borealis]MDR3621195.1 carbonic anhydrase [Paludisphaera borealis]